MLGDYIEDAKEARIRLLKKATRVEFEYDEPATEIWALAYTFDSIIREYEDYATTSLCLVEYIKSLLAKAKALAPVIQVFTGTNLECAVTGTVAAVWKDSTQLGSIGFSSQIETS